MASRTASLRKGLDPDQLTMEEAVTVLEAKAAKGGGRRERTGDQRRQARAESRRPAGRTAAKAGGGATKA